MPCSRTPRLTWAPSWRATSLKSFAKLEGAAFVSGNGTTQPQGFLSSADFTSINAGASTFTADNIIDLYHAIPSAYSSRGTWLMRRETMGAVRKLKTTGTGVYLWTGSTRSPATRPACSAGR